MAQNITIAGASYSAVPSIQVPKTGSGTATFVDTSDADATAAGIMSGLTAYVNGIKLTGTASGGLEYESGTWSPTSDTNLGTINFSKTHSKPPAIVACWYKGAHSALPSNTANSFVAVDYTAFGSTSWDNYAGARAFINKPSGGRTSGGFDIPYGGSNSGNSSVDYFRYFATESVFHPWNQASRYWRTTVVYNWIAIWA